MDDEEAFQAALDANPEDHTCRLVFADWLQERGDVRAEGQERIMATSRPTPASELRRAAPRFWEKVQKGADGECWLWIGRRNVESGYGYFDIGQRSLPAHRFSYELHCGVAGSLHVLHACDNPPCVNPAHLFLGTNLDNVRDKQAKGRQLRGEQVGTAKLTPEIVRSIRRRVASGESRKGVARSLKISDRHVRDIVNRKRWAHLSDAE